MKDKRRLTYSNFGKFRLRWLSLGDRYSRDAADLLATTSVGGEKGERLRRRAAELFKWAGNHSRQAGLGLLAKAAFTRSANLLAGLGLHADAEARRRLAESIPDYWREDA